MISGEAVAQGEDGRKLPERKKFPQLPSALAWDVMKPKTQVERGEFPLLSLASHCV